MVRQDLPDDDTTLLDVVLNSDTERASLFKELETTEDPERLAEIYMRLDDIDAGRRPFARFDLSWLDWVLTISAEQPDQRLLRRLADAGSTGSSALPRTRFAHAR